MISIKTKTKVKTFNKSSLNDVENNINTFNENVKGTVIQVDIKPFETMNGLRYLGIVTYQTSELLDGRGQQ